MEAGWAPLNVPFAIVGELDDFIVKTIKPPRFLNICNANGLTIAIRLQQARHWQPRKKLTG
jgi:hypothetical protein